MTSVVGGFYTNKLRPNVARAVLDVIAVVLEASKVTSVSFSPSDPKVRPLTT